MLTENEKKLARYAIATFLQARLGRDVTADEVAEACVPGSLIKTTTPGNTLTPVKLFTVPTNSTMSFGVRCKGVGQSTGNLYFVERAFVYHNVAGTTTADAAGDQDQFLNSGAGIGGLSHAQASNNVTISVTGSASEAVKWSIYIWAAEANVN